jgi:nuclear GTP-binding protein
MQTIKLDKLIKLFDSPGIVMSKETNPASLVLRNCVRVRDLLRKTFYYRTILIYE